MTSISKERFREYMTRNETVSFSFRRTEYNVTIVGASVFPQGFSAIADKLREFKNANMLCDIGNGTVSQTSHFVGK